MKRQPDGKERQKAATRAWLLEVLEKTGLSPTAWANAADLAQTTVNRFLKRPVKHMMTATTLLKLSTAVQMPVPTEILMTSGPQTDPETMRYALNAARFSLEHRSPQDRERLEPELIAQFYDVLMEQRRAGQSLEGAAATLQSWQRRTDAIRPTAPRKTGGRQPKPRSAT